MNIKAELNGWIHVAYYYYSTLDFDRARDLHDVQTDDLDKWGYISSTSIEELFDKHIKENEFNIKFKDTSKIKLFPKKDKHGNFETIIYKSNEIIF